MYYPAGIYASDKTYTVTEKLVPVVVYSGSYYYAKQTVPADHGYYPTNTTYWGAFSNFAAAFVEILFANYAKLGSFVISGDWFISQYGIFKPNANTVVEDSNNYSSFRYNDPTATGSLGYPCFYPYLAINAKTGKIYANNVEIKGIIHATAIYQECQSPSIGDTVYPQNGSAAIIPDNEMGNGNIYLPPASDYPFVTMTFYRYIGSVTRSWYGLCYISASGTDKIRIKTNRNSGFPTKCYCTKFMPKSNSVIKVHSIDGVWCLDTDETDMLFFD